MSLPRFLTLSLIVALLGLGWLAYSQQTACDALFVQHPHLAPSDSIKVGISDDPMTGYHHASLTFASLTAEDRLTIHSTASPESPPLLEQPAWQRLQLVAKGGSIHAQLTLTDGTQQSLTLPAKVTLTTTGQAIKVLNITRKKAIPAYRGELQVTVTGNQRLMLINQLPMETYLQAVVPNELPFRFGAEAVRAQAVAARTYAIRPRDKVWHEFDICDSQYCQAYYGQQTETPETTAILKETQGLVLLHQGTPIVALYSSSSGGVSSHYHQAFSDAKTQAFPSTPSPYLSVVADFPETLQPYLPLSDEGNLLGYLSNKTLPAFDAKSPHYRWERAFSKAELEAMLPTALGKLSSDSLTQRWIQPKFKAGQPFGSLKTIQVTQRGESGQAMSLLIESSTGRWLIQKEFCIRKALLKEGKPLPSAMIALQPNEATGSLASGLTVLGTGFGHGVGMSQYGASGMHQLGYSFDAILRHYYPNTQLGSVPLVLHPQTAQSQAMFGLRGLRPLLHVRMEQALPLGQALPRLQHPVWVRLNNQTFSLAPFRGKSRVFDVQAFWQEGQLNTLVWQGQHPQAKHLKVWLTLEPKA